MVVFGAFDKEAGGLGRVLVLSPVFVSRPRATSALSSMATARGFAWTRVPICSALAPSPTAVKMSSSRAVRIGAAGHEPADHLLEDGPGSTPDFSRAAIGLARKCSPCSMDMAFMAGASVPDEAVDWFSFEQVLGNDCRYVGGLNTPVPNSFRMDDHDGALVAEAHAAAGGELDIAGETARLDLAIERGENSKRTTGRARRNAFRFLLGADEQMKTEWFHCALRSKDHLSALRGGDASKAAMASCRRLKRRFGPMVSVR